MKGKLTTSIITLTRNRSLLLEKNLASLQKQTFKPNEIIVIDNNSTDQTQNLIKKHQKKLPIRSFKSSLSGYSALYNLGIKKARGKLICFLDDDCVADKNWLKELIQKHQQYSEDIIQGNSFSLPKNNLYAEIMGNHYQNWLKSNLIDKEELRFLDNKNLLVPKKLIDKYGGFSIKHNIGSEDIEFGLRMRKNGVKIIFQPKSITYHHERDNFKSFVQQHYRIAQSESRLDKNLKTQEKIGSFPRKKTLMNLRSAAQSELCYFKQKNLLKMIKLPFVYLILFFVRISGYFKKF